MVQITSHQELEAWLKDKPVDWAQVVAVRAALRVLPYAFVKQTPDDWVKIYALTLFRMLAISWAKHNIPALDISSAIHSAASRHIPDSASFYSAIATRYVVPSVFGALAAAALSNDAHFVAGTSAFNSVEAAASAAAGNIAVYSDGSVDPSSILYAVPFNSAGLAADHARSAIFDNISYDCDWLESRGEWNFASRVLSLQRLGNAGHLDGWGDAWLFAAQRLAALNQGHQVWIDWYNRRIVGHDAAFDIPGDTDRIEDKAILARLADATDEDFWDKGAVYVNTTLQRWIDEARERVAPKETPPQERDALTYGVNAAGKLDRLPATDQQHLRDAADQQAIYRDVREAALELQQEGQRLGARLEKALGRFIESLPESFAAAECYSVWRDGNSLRRIHLAHRAVAGGTDYDDKRLDPAMAEMLGDVLDRYNLFAFGDDGLRAKDDAAIPPQERAKAEDEAEKAAPLVDAMLGAPEIMTDIVRDDIVADQADHALQKSDPYYGQALVQFVKSTRNRIAALISGVAQQVMKSAKSVREGAEREVGAMIVRAPLIVTFVAANIEAIKTFATTAYANVSLQWLWDALAKLSGLF